MEKRNKFRHTFPCATAAGATPAFAQSSVTLYGDRRQRDRLPEQPNLARLNDGRQVRSEDEGQRLGGQPLRAEGQRRSRWQHEGDFPARVGPQLGYGCCPLQRRAVRSQAWAGVTNPAYGTLTTGRQYTSYYQTLSPYSPTTWLTGFGFYGPHPGNIDGLNLGNRGNNTIEYTSPAIRGLTVSGSYSLGGVAGSVTGGATLAAVIQYAAGPLGFAVAFSQINNSKAAGGTWASSSTTSNNGAQIGVSALTNGYQTARAQQRFAAGLQLRARDAGRRDQRQRTVSSVQPFAVLRVVEAHRTLRARGVSARGARPSAPFQHDAVLVGLPVRVRDGDYSPVLTPRAEPCRATEGSSGRRGHKRAARVLGPHIASTRSR